MELTGGVLDRLLLLARDPQQLPAGGLHLGDGVVLRSQVAHQERRVRLCGFGALAVLFAALVVIPDRRQR